ncbi:morphogenic membrane protein MmpB [Streptomyces sclerotialus]
MLWSDPSDDPSEELRKAEAMLRRAGIVLAVAAVLLLLLLGWSG